MEGTSIRSGIWEDGFMLDLLLNFFFPKRSLRGNEGSWVTADEERLMTSRPIRIDPHVLRERGMQHVDFIIAAGSYESSPLLQRAVRLFKYRRIRALEEVLGSMMTRASHLLPASNEIVLCPVPLHWRRRFERGFNQSELLAMHVARERGWTVRQLLKRVHATGSQAKRTKSERITAMHGHFRCVVTDVPVFVVLIDDVVTTGSTLDACAEELKRCGAHFVAALVVGAA